MIQRIKYSAGKIYKKHKSLIYNQFWVYIIQGVGYMILIGYKKCTTCKGIEKMLDEKDINYTYREIDKDVPTVKELKKWHKASGLDIKRFFNTSGLVYRDMNLKDKLADMTDDEKYKLLSTNGMLVKRPILIKDDGSFVAVGPDVKKYLA